jgi:hypothetical protein
MDVFSNLTTKWKARGQIHAWRFVGLEGLSDQEMVWTLLIAEGSRPLPGNDSRILIVYSVAPSLY